MDPITLAMGLAGFAPQIIKWITGSEHAASAAGTVVDIAREVTGQADGTAALSKITGDPALALQFRQAVMDKEADLDKAYFADRADARQRDTAITQSGRTNTRANFMVALDAIGLIVCLVVLAVYSDRLPGEAIALISTVASIFGLCLRDAHQFEFGSSRGSQEKTELLSRAPAVKG
jgi:hypothetical protein